MTPVKTRAVIEVVFAVIAAPIVGSAFLPVGRAWLGGGALALLAALVTCGLLAPADGHSDEGTTSGGSADADGAS